MSTSNQESVSAASVLSGGFADHEGKIEFRVLNLSDSWRYKCQDSINSVNTNVSKVMTASKATGLSTDMTRFVEEIEKSLRKHMPEWTFSGCISRKSSREELDTACTIEIGKGFLAACRDGKPLTPPEDFDVSAWKLSLGKEGGSQELSLDSKFWQDTKGEGKIRFRMTGTTDIRRYKENEAISRIDEEVSAKMSSLSKPKISMQMARMEEEVQKSLNEHLEGWKIKKGSIGFYRDLAVLDEKNGTRDYALDSQGVTALFSTLKVDDKGGE